MEVDQMVDFLFDRIESSPKYYIDYKEVPESITGGWVELTIPYINYKKLTTESSNSNFLSNLETL
jgi:hypothetical protein